MKEVKKRKAVNTPLDIVPSTGQTLLDSIPANILNEEIASSHLDIKSLINLSSVSQCARITFKPTFFSHFKKYAERSAKKQIEILFKIVKNLDTSHLRDFCERALKARDVDLLKLLTMNRKEILQEIKLPEKFVNENNTYDFNAIVAAIESDKNVEEALKKFRADLDGMVLDAVIKEKGFPFQAIIDAYRIADKKWEPGTNAYDVFNIKVIGYLQRLAPPWFKKALATGFFQIVEQGKECGDSFTLRSDKSIDPAKDVPLSGLGFDFYVNMRGWHVVSTKVHYGANKRIAQYIEKLFQIKETELTALLSPETKTLNEPKSENLEPNPALNKDKREYQTPRKDSCVIS